MEEISNKGGIQALFIKKDKRIRVLKDKLKELIKEKANLVDNFRASTDALLERVKELESVSLGTRPQTATILKKIGNYLQYLD